MKMKKLICVWRAQLRTTPDPALKPSWPPWPWGCWAPSWGRAAEPEARVPA